MVRIAAGRIALMCAALTAASADRLSLENERRWNTPPELTPEEVSKKTMMARFLPFTASFALNAGQSNAHSASVGFGQNGFSVSQSSSLSQGGQSTGNGGVVAGRTVAEDDDAHTRSLAASQSSSFSAGLGGISTSDSNSFSLHHPLLGQNSQANSNSFALGAASASSHANAGNGQATSGAQSSAGSQSASAAPSFVGVGQASSAAEAVTFPAQGQGAPIWTNIEPNYEHDAYHHRPNRPTLTVSQKPNGWTRPIRPASGPIQLEIGDSGCRRQQPEIHISHWQPNRDMRHGTNGAGSITIAKPTSGAASANKCDDKSAGQTHVSWQHRPGTRPQGHVLRPQTQIQGRPSLSIHSSGHRNPSGQQTHQSSASLSAISGGISGGLSVGQLNSLNRAESSAGSIVATNIGDSGSGVISGTISGSISNAKSDGAAVHGNRGVRLNGQDGELDGSGFVRFPGASHIQSIPREFVRSKGGSVQRSGRSEGRNPVESFLTDVTDAVVDLLELP